ncbi:hypothetical protein F9Z44_22290 (plasmid) [Hydrogenophaga sp. PBL-H3]|nr:hypothetical protein [uncultured bacterium]QHE78952.1 hypothetical protein F9Z45_22290 [Hydrogenophaga sp. PBL-H3]QHE83372.1 hypothetical protein F9Z44_22290 [Hydrogenophaga sp. PBL-H3]QHE89498.1 hypothetical protein F9K07_31090 [Hydrogenophaga sp. BPS33]
MQDVALIESLGRATSLQLYQLAAVVERLLTDPRRIVAIRRDLHLGQVVRFYDDRHDKMRLGRVIEMRDTQVTLEGTEVRGQWRLPYAAIEPPMPGDRPQTAAAATEPSPPRPTRADFHRGQKISFTDRHLQVHVGVITRCNPKTATVSTGDGNSWSVPYGALRHVLDV